MTTTPHLSSARRLGASLVLALVTALVVLAPPPAEAAATLSARPAIVGERLVLTGWAPATRPRPVRGSAVPAPPGCGWPARA